MASVRFALLFAYGFTSRPRSKEGQMRARIDTVILAHVDQREETLKLKRDEKKRTSFIS